MSESQQSIVLAGRPDGWVKPEHFTLQTAPLPTAGQGEVQLRHRFLSVDPYMRGRMNDVKSYVPPFQMGEPIMGGGVAEVVESHAEGWQKGDLVVGMLPWTEYSAMRPEGLRKLPEVNAPLSWHLGILGMPGMTAYVGLMEVAKLQPGDSVFVNAAAGAVGSVVGQIARAMGCHVVGSAGGPEKVAHLTDTLGFSAAFDYRAESDLRKTLRTHFPKGIDVLFENVGGPQFEAAIANMAVFGRIALCGMIADYNVERDALPPGPKGMTQLIGRNVMLQGFIVSNYPDAAAKWAALAGRLLSTGQLQYHETVSEGLASAPEAFISMLRGGNLGKQVVQVAAE
ncbi:MAG: NADP-dependent oxidoreductase [Pseudomonadota bacterium]